LDRLFAYYGDVQIFLSVVGQSIPVDIPIDLVGEVPINTEVPIDAQIPVQMAFPVKSAPGGDGA
jgi:hypothetical protein